MRQDFSKVNNLLFSMPYKILALTILLCCCFSINITNHSMRIGNDFDLMAQIASIAYEPPQNIKAWNCSFCYDRDIVKSPTVFGASGLQGFIVYESRSFIIGFRGTSNPFDIMKYANANKSVSYPNCKGCMVHSGFYSAWNLIRLEFYFALQKMMSLYRSIATILIFGHGLGGVFGTFAIPELLDLFPIKPYIVYNTFGQPRFGNSEFSSYIQDLVHKLQIKGFRTVHYADLVSQLLPLGYYVHSPKIEFWCDEDMNDLDKCFDDADGECSNSLSEYDLEDHPIEEYLKD